MIIKLKLKEIQAKSIITKSNLPDADYVINHYSFSVKDKIQALQLFKRDHIKVYVFIGPIIPFITDWKEIINSTGAFVDTFMFENLNLHGTIIHDIFKWFKTNRNSCYEELKSIARDSYNYWQEMKAEISDYCNKYAINFKIYFDHKQIRKNRK